MINGRKPNKEYEQKSNERLSKIIEEKIRTTMIGSLSAIEEGFGFLWNNGQPLEDKEAEEERQELEEIFREIRSKILGVGNDRIRTMKDELSRHTVVWDRYQLQLPVVKDYKQYQELKNKGTENE